MDNAVDLPGYKHYLDEQGERPSVMVAFLDIEASAGARTNGMAIPVRPGEFRGLDARERNYRRVELTGQLDCELCGRVWAYVGLDEARVRAARGRRERRLVVASGYYDQVLASFDVLGQRDLFAELTAPCPPLADLRLVVRAPQAAPRVTALAGRIGTDDDDGERIRAVRRVGGGGAGA